MSDVKIQDLSPVPFFAHFLEGQFCKELTAEQMKAVLGGSVVTMAAPSDQEGMPVGELPDAQELLRRIGERVGQIPGHPFPGSPVTLAYPSDHETVPL
jgi:Serine endopeptidase inhibitors